MPDHADILARVRAALDAWDAYPERPDSAMVAPPTDDSFSTSAIRSRTRATSVARLTDGLRVEQAATHQCEAIDAALERVRKQCDWLRTVATAIPEPTEADAAVAATAVAVLNALDGEADRA